MRVLVIGAGASGLVTAKTLLEAGHDVSIVEASCQIGGTFENKAYKDARMVSSKHLTCFSDFRRPDAEMHMTLVDYTTYLREYAEHFGLLARLRFETEVLSVEKQNEDYCVELHVAGRPSNKERYDAVAVCSGLHNIPRIPSFKKEECFKGGILHSSLYKDPSIFEGRKVLIVGTGETAFDLGYAAATHGARSVTMSTRHGFVSVPASFGETNPPLDCIIMNFATHAWESNWAQRVGMHWWVTTKFTRLGFLLTTGCSYGFNQWVGRRHNLSWDEGRKHIVNKSSRCMPLLSRKAKKQAPWWQRWLYGWWDSGVSHVDLDIDLVEGSIVEFSADGVQFETKSGQQRVEADLVILATGYRQKFPFLRLAKSVDEIDDPLPAQHFIVDPDQPRMAYIGFIRPNVGAIPPMSEMQAMWWTQRLANALTPQTEQNHLDRACYKLRGCHLPYGVDYGYYMFALAREIGSMPSLLYWLVRNWRICATCALGQAHVPIFRLQGPFQVRAAEESCSRELFGVLLKRPLLMNLTFLVEALCFGLVNGLAELLERYCSPMATLGLLGGSALLLTKHGLVQRSR
mmetsp:Transcript_54048/g.126245  ORF Transcript_54048/g.126245 Transcript_54048/m.126245 type:complete len:573 (-) Transcript_54048:208-1926(-)